MDDGGVIGCAGKDFFNAGGKMCQWKCVIGRVKRALIPAFAESRAIVEIGVVFVGVALVRVSTYVFAVIDQLKVAMFFNDPGHLLAHKGSQDGGGIFIVIVRRINIADVMQECCHDPICICAIAFCAGGGL